jgi:hypothetical protein
MEALLGATALYYCQLRGEGHPKLGELQNTSLNLLAGAAARQGVEVKTLEDLRDWMAQQQLNDPNVYLPQLIQRLEAMVFNPDEFRRQS